MKKFLNIVLVFVFTILLVPTFVFAEGEDKKEEVKKAPIQIYEFYGSSCGYCAALNSWFESIEKDYGDYFDLVKYEVWGSEKNNALMNGVAQKMGDAINGVPYLIVGDYTLNGYSESDNEAILKAILDEYGKDESSRVTTATDYINNFKFEEKEFNGVVVGVVVAVVAVGLVVIIVKAREE